MKRMWPNTANESLLMKSFTAPSCQALRRLDCCNFPAGPASLALEENLGGWVDDRWPPNDEESWTAGESLDQTQRLLTRSDSTCMKYRQLH